VTLANIDEAVAAGASQAAACALVGLDERTVQRWRTRPDLEDQRRGPTRRPGNALTATEEAELVALLTSKEFGGLSPHQLVAKLADQGRYFASDRPRVTEALLGKRVGKSTVSRVTKRLEDQVDELRRQRLTEPFAYLYLDATFVDARWARSVENVSALVAYGIGTDNKRHLLGIHIGVSESEASWTELLTELVERGLSGVQLIIRDEHAGLAAAARKVLPEAKQQRCTVHLTRNVMANVPKRHQKRLGREVVKVLHAEALDDAKRNLKAFRLQFFKQFPEAVECLARGFDDATTYFAFPEAHHVRIRTTNGLERLHGEIKRRTRAIGAFPDRASALRLITAVALQVTSIWSDRIYLDVSLLDDHHAAAA
jgi:putative transposase